jgi:hypothetical protein
VYGFYRVSCDSPKTLSGATTGERYHVTHGVARHSPLDLDGEALRMIDSLTALDRHVYREAQRLFARRVLELEPRLGRKMLCE